MVTHLKLIVITQLCIILSVISGTMKTTAQLKEVCESEFNQSKWIDNKCCYFHNKEVKSFDDAQKICSDKFKKYGFNNGRIYEPRNAETFVKIYKLAEEFADYPTLQIWLGLNDNEKDGQFRYDSDNGLPTINAPWGTSQPNGGTRENCLTSFIPDNDKSPKWFDRPCLENDSIGDYGHRFMCECHIEEENMREKVSINSPSKDHLKVDEARANLMAEIKACNGGVSCLTPVDGNNSTKTETIGENDLNSTEHPSLASSSTRTQNPDSSNIQYTATTKDTKSATSASKETAEPLVQNNSSTAGPIVDSSSKSTRKFDGWSFFGGIIVTIGTAAIAFIGVKYYQARNIRSQNYNLM